MDTLDTFVKEILHLDTETLGVVVFLFLFCRHNRFSCFCLFLLVRGLLIVTFTALTQMLIPSCDLPLFLCCVHPVTHPSVCSPVVLWVSRVGAIELNL